MAYPFLGYVLMLGSQATSTTPPDLLKLLNAPDNAVRSCEIVHRADGGHLLINMRKHGAGDAIHIEPYLSGESYDYIFSGAGKTSRHFNFRSNTLGKLNQIDIPLRKALGVTEKKPEPIFTRNGIYEIYIGYGFRESDEAEIYGACRLFIKVK